MTRTTQGRLSISLLVGTRFVSLLLATMKRGTPHLTGNSCTLLVTATDLQVALVSYKDRSVILTTVDTPCRRSRAVLAFH